MYVVIGLQQDHVQSLEPLDDVLVVFSQVGDNADGFIFLSHNVGSRLGRVVGNGDGRDGHVPDLKIPVRLHLHKTIPFGAGLGGGSADATATLQALNQLLGLGLTTEQLTPYAARLGSDTVFFLHDTPMLGSGRGERLTPYPDLDLSGWWLKLVKPDLNISTAEAYAGVTPHLPTAPLSEILRQPVEQWRETLVNEEAATIEKFKEEGMTVTYLTDEEMAAFEEAVADFKQEMFDYFGADACAAFGIEA